jgi:hypothetical protein
VGRLIALAAHRRTGVCLVRAENQESGGFLISVTTNPDISVGARIQMSESVVSVERAIDLVSRFLEEWAEDSPSSAASSSIRVTDE